MSYRRCGRKLAVITLGALAAIVGLPGSAAADTELAVRAGYGGYGQADRPYPVRIEVTSDVLFSGELRISSPNSRLAIVRPVEVPGGTAREIIVVWEAAPWGVEETVVQLLSGGEPVAQTRVRLIEPRGADLVGVFPALAGRRLPDKAPLLADAGEAMLFRVDPATLGAGWAALEPLDVVVATAADLRGLDSSGLDALLGWVNRGGRLLVDEPIGTEIPGVPAPWRPDDARPRMAGQGEIVLTGGAAAAGDWESVLEPALTRSRRQEGVFGEVNTFWGRSSLGSQLGRDAGVGLPGSGWLLAMIGAYIAAAGPGVWLLSRRLRRPGLAWVLIPLVAAGFAAGVWAFGRSFRNSARTAHATVVEVAPRGTVATSYSLLHSRGGDSASLPPGWLPVAIRTDPQRTVLDLADEPEGLSASIRLDAGEFSVLAAGGALPGFDGALEVTARSASDGQVAGTVANNLAVDLHQVAVLADEVGVNIGTVPAGATVEFDYAEPAGGPVRGGLVEFELWSDAADTFVPSAAWSREPAPGAVEARPESAADHSDAVNLALWAELGARWSANSRPVGQVVVAAWSDELAPPLGPEAAAGRTLLVARAPIEPAGGRLSDMAVPRHIVGGPADLGPGFAPVDGWESGAMHRFVVPEEAAGTDLVLVVPRGSERVDLWTGAEWRRVDLAGPHLDTAAVFLLPTGAIHAGRVYLRVLAEIERFGVPAMRELSVRSRRSGDEPSVLSYAADFGAGDGSALEGGFDDGPVP